MKKRMRKAYEIDIPAGIDAIKRLMRDKGDTQGYIAVNVALNGKGYKNIIEQWSETPQGKRYIAGERLPLDKKFKKGTVGAVRQKFLGKYEKSGDLRNLHVPPNPHIAYANWQVDLHDISHIMTDYGQDGLGELYRIEFEINQSYQRGFQIISWLFQLRILSLSYKRFRQVRPMIKEAQQRAKACDDIYLIDWFEYLDKPYEWVKETIAQVPPVKLYNPKDESFKDLIKWVDRHF